MPRPCQISGQNISSLALIGKARRGPDEGNFPPFGLYFFRVLVWTLVISRVCVVRGFEERVCFHLHKLPGV